MNSGKGRGASGAGGNLVEHPVPPRARCCCTATRSRSLKSFTASRTWWLVTGWCRPGTLCSLIAPFHGLGWPLLVPSKRPPAEPFDWPWVEASRRRIPPCDDSLDPRSRARRSREHPVVPARANAGGEGFSALKREFVSGLLRVEPGEDLLSKSRKIIESPSEVLLDLARIDVKKAMDQNVAEAAKPLDLSIHFL